VKLLGKLPSGGSGKKPLLLLRSDVQPACDVYGLEPASLLPSPVCYRWLASELLD